MSAQGLHRGTIWAVAAFVSAAMVSPFAHAAPPAPAAGEKVRVTLQTFGTSASGATREADTLSIVAAPGESVVLAVGAGTFDGAGRAQPGFCGGFSRASSDAGAAAGQAPHVWIATIDVRDAGMKGIELVVRWEHVESAQIGRPVQVRGDTRALTLREGEHHLLDFADAGDGAGECPRSVLVQLRADIVEDPKLADTKFALDAWLVDEAGDGSKQVHRLALDARQGDLVEFVFPALSWPVPKFQFDHGDRAEVWAEISGTVRGRLRQDGSFELMLDAGRSLGVRRSGSPEQAALGDGGTKIVRVASGETVRLVLPSPRGYFEIGRDGLGGAISQDSPPLPTSAADGVRFADDRLGLSFGPFLAGHKMSILLAAHRF